MMNQIFNKNLIILFWTITLSRIFSMIYIPLTDTTEARYGHIALLMAKTGDWITPYFDYNVPFWGKPPLSFWAEALSYKIFGIYDFAPRVPSLIVTLLTAWLIYIFLKKISSKTSALLGVVIYSSMLLVYALSGVILTDTYLTFSTTLSLIAFLMVIGGEKKYWDYLFFVGLGLGLLAKGPLALVIVGGIIFIWILFSFKKRIKTILMFPLLKGTFLMLLIALPWYILAELKTPGFLHYFIVGEHFDRFVDSGWSGDLYGTSHKKPHGTIWLFWIYSSLPWGIMGLIVLLKNLFTKGGFLVTYTKLKEENISLLVVWMLFVMLFFSMAGNILWTYILPSLPAFAVILALYIYRDGGKFLNHKILYFNSFFVPIVTVLATIYILFYPASIPTEKFLIKEYKTLSKDKIPIYFVQKQSFSTKYYMNRKIDEISINRFNKLATTIESKYFFVIKKGNSSLIKNISKFKKVYSSKRYVLFVYK